jgi:ubiquitin conjugation factor E4 B
MQDLKLSDPERFSFKPKPLLAAIAQIYLNLGNEPAFIRAVANDGRSYTKELFERFARVLKNRAIMTEGEAEQIVLFTQRVEDARVTILEEDEREVPDEFLDPLLATCESSMHREREHRTDSFTVMKDPVILPVSRVVIDRSTIRAVLLSKEQDPFNNVPCVSSHVSDRVTNLTQISLKYEDIIPDTELKAKIDAWVAEGKVEKSNAMDVE